MVDDFRSVGLGIKSRKQFTQARWEAVSYLVSRYLKKEMPEEDFDVIIFRKEVKHR